MADNLARENQLDVLEDIRDGIGQLVEAGGGTPPTPVAAVPGMISATGSGNTPAGTYMVSIKNVGSSPGTVAGVPLAPGEAITWEAPQGKTLAAVAYNGTGTTLLVATTA